MAASPSGSDPPDILSEGQCRLRGLRASLAEIASAIGSDRSTVSLWKAGKRTPAPEWRARLQSAFGIPAASWEVGPGASIPLPPPPPTPGETAPPSTLQDCLALLSVIRADRSAVQITPGERVKLASAEARILALRATLEQTAELSEARYVTGHPSWIRLRKAIVAALEPHPIAAQAVIDAIDRFQRGDP